MARSPSTSRLTPNTSPLAILLARQFQHGLQPAFGMIAQRETAAVQRRDVAGNPQAQAVAAQFTAAGFLQPVIRIEYFFQLLLGNSGAGIAHPDGDRVAVVLDVE